MKRIFKIILPAMICLIIISIVTGNIAGSSLGNMRLDNLTCQLSGFPVPNETVVLEQQSTFGALRGVTGEFEDYLTVLLVKSDLSKEELQEYYQSGTFETVLSPDQIEILLKTYCGDRAGKALNEEGVYPVEVHVNYVMGDELNTIQDYFIIDENAIDFPLNVSLIFKTLSEVEDYSNYYYIMLYDGGYPNPLDMCLLSAPIRSRFN